MALGDPYITGVQLGAYMGVDATIAASDTNLAQAAATASRDINKYCGRDFQQAAAPSARLYVPKSPLLVYCEDFFTTTGLVIQILLNGSPQGDPLTSDLYELLPLNGYADGEVKPYNGFRFPWPHYRYLWGYNRVQITAQWGWAAVPDPVIRAAYIRGAELYKLADAPLGVVQVGSGNNSVNSKVREVPHWQSLLSNYQTQEKKVYLG